MLFITANKINGEQKEVTPMSDSLKGIQVLNDLISHVRRPRNLLEEELALLILKKMPDEKQFNDEELTAVKELYDDMSRLKQAEVELLAKWIYPWRLGIKCRFSPKKKKGLRHLHLLVLLAKITAPLYHFEIIKELDALGLRPDRDECYLFLDWLPHFFCFDKCKRIARHYIDITIDTWYGDTVRPSYWELDEIYQEYQKWPIQKQILELLAWQQKWDEKIKDLSNRDLPVNPTYYADTIEFLLARNNAYSKLKKAGGPIFKVILKNMRYTDYRRSERATDLPYAYIVAALVFVVIATAGYFYKSKTINRWHDVNLTAIKSHENENQLQINTLYQTQVVDLIENRNPGVDSSQLTMGD